MRLLFQLNYAEDRAEFVTCRRIWQFLWRQRRRRSARRILSLLLRLFLLRSLISSGIRRVARMAPWTHSVGSCWTNFSDIAAWVIENKMTYALRRSGVARKGSLPGINNKTNIIIEMIFSSLYMITMNWIQQFLVGPLTRHHLYPLGKLNSGKLRGTLGYTNDKR